MKPTPLLDLWQKPDGAGEPLAVLATTFAFDPDFFERDCLARFVAVESVDEGTGSADDLVARLELEESLRAPIVVVLADRSAQAERSSLRWDLLHCQVDGGLLHSKVAILIWENVTRVMVGSANLTPAGYRQNIELVMAADLGPACMFPRTVLDGLADEVESYLDLVPGLNPAVPARQRASRMLELFRTRSAQELPTRSPLTAAIAPTNRRIQPLDSFRAVWSGTQPLRATHVSPYWDAHDGTVLEAVRALLTGRPASKRSHDVAVTIGPGGETSFPPIHLKNGLVDKVVELGPIDDNVRPLHAKCLVFDSDQWVAVLIGSSNHTRAGLGLAGSRRHRELNVWLGAPADSREGMALRGLVPRGTVVDIEAPYQPADDEDEAAEVVVLPSFFQLCRLSKSSARWTLTLTFATANSPTAWSVMMPNHDLVIDHHEWRRQGSPSSIIHRLTSDELPMFVDAEWEGSKASWVVIADDRHDLPPNLGLMDLRSADLLEALASGRTLAQALRDKLERDAQDRQGAPVGIVVDPLKRFDSRGTLLRRGRALAAALSALEHRLARTATTLDALEARLSGPLGPRFIGRKVLDDYASGAIERSEAMFTVAEVALVVSRVDWGDVLQHVDHEQGLALINDLLDEFIYLGSEVGNEPADLTSYLQRAIEEVRRCLVS